jgi:hypothetical protein
MKFDTFLPLASSGKGFLLHLLGEMSQSKIVIITDVEN